MKRNRCASLSSSKRARFVLEMIENAMKPYEMSEGYEEEIIGEFENSIEQNFFECFINLLKEPEIFLDLACGDGRHTVKLCEGTRFVVGVDLSKRNLVKDSRKSFLKGKDNVGFIHANMFNIPLKSACFSRIWFSQAFEYVPPEFRRKLVNQLWRALKSNGKLYMSVESWQHPSFGAIIKEFLGDLSLFLYWKVIKRKPLAWEEFLYLLPPSVGYKSLHYHVRTSKKNNK
ncbi:MAG: class I SAM-dependent methyltransferase [Candidatus Bathycorpusculaceae bacterium]